MKKYKTFTFGGAGRNIAESLASNNKLFHQEQEDILYHFNTDRQPIAFSTLLKNKYLIGKDGLGSANNIDNAKKGI